MVARRLRVGTANLLHGLDVRTGSLDLRAVAEGLRALDADVLALQEVDRDLARSGQIDQTRRLAELLGMEGVFVPALLGSPDTSWTAVPADDDGAPGYGVAVLSRLPVVAAERHALPGGGDGERRPGATPSRPGWDREPRTALAVDVDHGGHVPLRVTSFHLSYLPWRAARQLQAAARAAAAGGGPAVLAGDCNLPAQAVRALLRRRWAHAGGQPTYPAWQPRLQVDQIAVTGGVAVEAVERAPAGTSDHLPMVARLRLPER